MASILTPSVGEIWKNKNSNEKVVIRAKWTDSFDEQVRCVIWWAEIVENIGARLIMKPTDISENNMIEHWERHQTIEQRLNRIGTAGYSWFGIESRAGYNVENPQYSVEEITPLIVDNHDNTIMFVTEKDNYTTKRQMGKQMFCSLYFETSHNIELGDVFVACSARPRLDNNGRYFSYSRLILHEFIDEGDKKYFFRRWDGVSSRSWNRPRYDRYDRAISPEDLFILFRRVRYFSYVHQLSVLLTLIHNDRSTDVPIYHPLTFGNPIPTTTNRDPYPGQIWTRNGLVYYIAFESRPTRWVLKELTAGDRDSREITEKMSINSENGWSFVMRYVEHWDWFPNHSLLFNQRKFLREINLLQGQRLYKRTWRLTTEYYNRRFSVGQIYQRNMQRRPHWITPCRYWKELDPDDNRYKPKVSNLINNSERQRICGNYDSGHKVMIIDIYGDGSWATGGALDEIYYCSMSVGLWNGEDSTSSRERGFYFQDTYRIYKSNVRQFDAIFHADPRGSNSSSNSTTTTTTSDYAFDPGETEENDSSDDDNTGNGNGSSSNSTTTTTTTNNNNTGNRTQLTDFDFFHEPSNISGSSSGSSSSSSNNNKRKAESNKKSTTKKAKKGDIRCGICLTNEANTIFLPCGHLYTCYDCAKKCKDVYGGKCPICKRKINSLMRIFVSATVDNDELKMLNNLRIKF